MRLLQILWGDRALWGDFTPADRAIAVLATLALVGACVLAEIIAGA